MIDPSNHWLYESFGRTNHNFSSAHRVRRLIHLFCWFGFHQLIPHSPDTSKSTSTIDSTLIPSEWGELLMSQCRCQFPWSDLSDSYLFHSNPLQPSIPTVNINVSSVFNYLITLDITSEQATKTGELIYHSATSSKTDNSLRIFLTINFDSNFDLQAIPHVICHRILGAAVIHR